MSIYKPFTWLTPLIVQWANLDRYHQVKTWFLQFLSLIWPWFWSRVDLTRLHLLIMNGWYEQDGTVGNGSTGVLLAVPLTFVFPCRTEQGPCHGLMPSSVLCIHWGGWSSRYFWISVGNSGQVFREHWTVPSGRPMEVELATHFCHIHPHPCPHDTLWLSLVLHFLHSWIISLSQTSS